MTPFLAMTIPGQPTHLRVLRTTLAAVAAGLGMTIDQVEDVRLAVEEAAAQVLDAAPTHITVVVRDASSPLCVEFRATTSADIGVAPDSFGHMILTALTHRVDTRRDGGDVVMVLEFPPAPASTRELAL